MDKIRLVAMDLDGTLLDANKEVYSGIFPYLEKLKSNGILYTIATGRGFQSARKYAKILKIELPVVALDGTLVRTSERILHRVQLEYEDILKIRDSLRFVRKPVFVVFYNQNDALVPLATRHDVDLSRWDAKPIYLSWEELISKKPLRCFVVADYDVLARIKKSLDNNSNNLRTDVFPSEVYGYYYLDIKPKNANKGIGLRVLKEYLNLESSQTIVIGDNYNDLEMFMEAGVRIALANAVPELKQLADFVTKNDNTKGGIVEALKWILERYGNSNISG